MWRCILTRVLPDLQGHQQAAPFGNTATNCNCLLAGSDSRRGRPWAKQTAAAGWPGGPDLELWWWWLLWRAGWQRH